MQILSNEMSQEGAASVKQNHVDKGYSKASKHSILFIQSTNDPATRTYLHFASVGEALDGFFILFRQ